MATLAERREAARRIAATIVAVAIGVVATTLVVFSIALTIRGGPGFLFLSVILFALGVGLGLVGFFFQLVPFRLDELAERQREHAARLKAGDDARAR